MTNATGPTPSRLFFVTDHYTDLVPRRHGGSSERPPPVAQGTSAPSFGPYAPGRQQHTNPYLWHTLPHPQSRAATHLQMGFHPGGNIDSYPGSRLPAAFRITGGSQEQQAV